MHVGDSARRAGEVDVLADGATEEVRLEGVGRLEVEGEEVAHRVPDDRAVHGRRLWHQRSKRREHAASRHTPEVRGLRVDAISAVVVQPAHRVDDVVDLRRERGLTAEAVAQATTTKPASQIRSKKPSLPLGVSRGARR